VCCIAASYCITDVTYRTNSYTNAEQSASEVHPDLSCTSGNKILDQQASAVTSVNTTQDSVLFLAHVHDAPASVVFKFADDLVSTIVANDMIPDVQKSLQEAMDQLAEWAHQWDMLLNISKTKVMLFGAPNQSLDVTTQGIRIPVEQLTHFKFLGVWIDEHLSFTEQADYAAKPLRLFPRLSD